MPKTSRLRVSGGHPSWYVKNFLMIWHPHGTPGRCLGSFVIGQLAKGRLTGVQYLLFVSSVAAADCLRSHPISRSSTAFWATSLARPIRLVQFEQRSGDKLRGILSLVCGHRIWALAYCPYCPLIPGFGYIRWRIWKQAKEWTVRKDSKFCDLR